MRNKTTSKSQKVISESHFIKALLYFHAADALKFGMVSLKPSISLENYMHPKTHWQANKNRLLKEAGLHNFSDIDSLLKLLKKQLHASYHKTNHNIKFGKNVHIKFDKKDRMILITPKIEKINTQPVSAYLPTKNILPY